MDNIRGSVLSTPNTMTEVPFNPGTSNATINFMWFIQSILPLSTTDLH